MTWLALDFGGANLKAVDRLGWALSVPFALWQQPDKLSIAIGELIQGAPSSSRLAIASTGKLCAPVSVVKVGGNLLTSPAPLPPSTNDWLRRLSAAGYVDGHFPTLEGELPPFAFACFSASKRAS